MAALQGAQDGGTFFPPQATEAAAEHDSVFFLIFWISAFFFALINVAAVYFAIRYRRRAKGEPVEKSPSHNTKIELVWTIIPTLIVCYLFWIGMTGYVDRRTAPAGAYTVYVTGQKWSWSFAYPEGFVSNELHAPVGRAVKLVIGSTDVLHSVYIPAFRVKMDAVPGRYTEAWFESNRPGTYNLFCAEYCGQQHSMMGASVVIHADRAGFDEWVKEQTDLGDLTPVELGALLYTRKGCNTCHTLDGARLVGPSFKDLYGSPREFEGGGTAIADEAYLREAIMEPTARVTKDYSPTMPDFKNGPIKIEASELVGFIEFIKSLSADGAAEQAQAPGEAPEQEQE
ncbi:MAG: cytochrome c oxidase subunit II [Planctomycetes bacterium]|nr:cytochrome c oxidase subunit II [Planctomycetota bacterium]MBL7008626.1 cytochrome c oxidase subunit II [Planctomycetota bacterium]